MAVLSLKTGNKARGMLAGYDPGVFIPIASTVVGSGGQSTISFSSIPSTYTHLQIRAISKWSTSASADYSNLIIQFNSDSGSNYARHRIYGNGSTVLTTSSANTNGYTSLTPNSVSAYNNMFSAHIIDILDYANTNKYKVIRGLGGFDTNSSTYSILDFISTLWMNTAAISSISFSLDSNNFAQYSHFALYGIKGA